MGGPWEGLSLCQLHFWANFHAALLCCKLASFPHHRASPRHLLLAQRAVRHDMILEQGAQQLGVALQLVDAEAEACVGRAEGAGGRARASQEQGGGASQLGAPSLEPAASTAVQGPLRWAAGAAAGAGGRAPWKKLCQAMSSGANSMKSRSGLDR